MQRDRCKQRSIVAHMATRCQKRVCLSVCCTHTSECRQHTVHYNDCSLAHALEYLPFGLARSGVPSTALLRGGSSTSLTQNTEPQHVAMSLLPSTASAAAVRSSTGGSSAPRSEASEGFSMQRLPFVGKLFAHHGRQCKCAALDSSRNIQCDCTPYMRNAKLTPVIAHNIPTLSQRLDTA
jgi:hypothetical protein